MIIVNTPTVPNKEITEVHGIARGSTVRARNVGRDIFAGLNNIVGGEVNILNYKPIHAIKRYSTMNKTPLDQVLTLWLIYVFTTTMVMKGRTEMLAYGTAVTIK